MTSIVENWSTTADNNSNADPAINWAEGQLPGTVNNSARSMMMRLKQFAIDIGGSLVAGGTADALTITAGSPYSTYVDGIILAFRASDDNTGAATLNVNGIGTASIRKITSAGDADLAAGDLRDGGVYMVLYSSVANSSAGGWMLVSGGGVTKREDGIAGFIGVPAEKAYRIALNMPFDGTILKTTTRSASGTCTATFSVNSTPLGGSANSVSSSEVEQAHSSDNEFSAGDDLVLTISSNTACLDLSFMVEFSR